MRVGAADAERRHSGAPRPVDSWPLRRLRRDTEAFRTVAGLRCELFEMQLLRDEPVVHAEYGLDETGHAGRGLEVAQVRLDRAEHQRCRAGAVAVDLAERVKFNGIAQRGPGAVGLDVVDLRGRQPGHLECAPHERLLRWAVRHRLTAARAVLVDRRPTNDRQHPVSVALGIGETLEHDHTATFAAHVTVGVGVEGLTRSVRCEHAPARARDVVLRSQDQVDAGGQGVVTLAAAQALAG